MKKIAIIGGGVAGIVSAHLLQKKYEVTLFEKEEKIGGHTNTICFTDPVDGPLEVDTGFIVCNDRTYPNFHRFLSELDVPVRYADMSFSVFDEATGLTFCSRSFKDVFANRRNLISPKFLKFLYDITRFWKVAQRDVELLLTSEMTVGEYLRLRNIPLSVAEYFILPISAAIWSASEAQILSYPCSLFFRFYKNHGLLNYIDQPRWQTVVGGSHSYLAAFKRTFSGKIHTGSPVKFIIRNSTSNGVTVQCDDGRQESFDHCVVAAHADDALQLLGEPSQKESELLGTFGYETNMTYLHTDESFLPPNKKALASWNYIRERGQSKDASVAVTYSMNTLQGLNTKKHYLVTLNPTRVPDPKTIIKEIAYRHPQFTLKTAAAQKRLTEIQGIQNTWFCGSYHRFGFHEDAVMSAVNVCEMLGVEGFGDRERLAR